MKKIYLLVFFAFSILIIENTNAQYYWTETDKTLPVPYPNGRDDKFGEAVSIDGNYAAVGATGNEEYVNILYNNGTSWEIVARLLPSNVETNINFGKSVCISGDYVVVGATYNACAYLYEKPATGWTDTTQTAILTSSDNNSQNAFGSSISVSGNYVVVGASYSSHNGIQYSGAAYIFEKPATGWTDTTQTAKLTASDGIANAYFGSSVSISGNCVVIGAYGDDDNGDYSGSAYVFEKSETGWSDTIQTAKLTASDGLMYDYFGFSVSISGNYVVIGAYGDDRKVNKGGSVYVFEKPATGWIDANQTAKLTASDGQTSDIFGQSVNISGDNIVVGVGANNSFSRISSSYFFKRPTTGWINATETAKFAASDGKDRDYFGYSVSISGNNILIGSYGNNRYTGAAYIFGIPGTGVILSLEDQKIFPNNNLNNIQDRYGDAVSIDGNYAVIGAPGDHLDRGSAYVMYFNGLNWENIAKLTASNGETADYFGSSVCISGDCIVIGSESYYSNNNKGAAYIFEKPATGWTDTTQTAKLTASDGIANAYFGSSVSISNNFVIVGAPYANNKCGAAYIFEKPLSGWKDTTQTAKLRASDLVNYSRFGNAVSISGNYAIIGAYTDENNGEISGSAYVFEKPETGWTDTTQTAKLTASDGKTNDYFGSSICISGDYAIIGAYTDENNGEISGSAYVFEKPATGWSNSTQNAKLNTAGYNSLNGSVCISGDYLIVGKYIFEKPSTGWVDTTQDVIISDTDWSSVSISGNVVVAGFNSSNDNGYRSGSAYFYKRVPNNSPTDVSLDISNFDETIVIGSQIGIFTTTDPDEDQIHTYSFISGDGLNDADNTKFIIVGDQLQTAAEFDYEMQNIFNIYLQTNDSYGGTYSKSILITANNLNDNAPNMEDSSFILDENSGDATSVGILTAIDADGDLNALTYSIIVGNTNNAFSVDSLTGEINVNQSTALDFEATQSFMLTIEVSDSSFTDTATMTINLNNLNDNVPILEDYSFTIDENSANSAFIGIATATDADGDLNALSYSLIAGNTNEAFVIDNSTGEIKVNQSTELDFETTSSFALTVQVTDGTNASDAAITINLNDLDETGIEDLLLAGIKVYPNPTNGIVTVDFSNANNPVENIEIINMKGQILYNIQIYPLQTSTNIDLSSNAKGVYFIKIKIADEIKVGKLIIE